jgi:hypothetical protein
MAANASSSSAKRVACNGGDVLALVHIDAEDDEHKNTKGRGREALPFVTTSYESAMSPRKTSVTPSRPVSDQWWYARPWSGAVYSNRNRQSA